MHLTHSFSYFYQQNRAHGLQVQGDAATFEPTANAQLIASNQQQQLLRLSWCAQQQRLTLEISHGADNDSSGWWLEVFSCQVTAEHQQLVDASGSFAEALSYALQLASPNHLATTPR